MPNPGTINGTHHLTFCVGGAQEDYDFHVRTLGLKSVKKTVLFDGEIPIYHLYYANRVGDASTILTALPVPPGRLDGQARDQPAANRSTVAVPAESIGYWADRLAGGGDRDRAGRALRHAAAGVRAPVRHPVHDRGRDVEDDARARTAAATCPAEHAIRGAFGTDHLGARARADGLLPARGHERRARSASEGAHHQYRIGTGDGHGRILELVEEPDLPQGTWQFGEGTIHHHAFDAGTRREPVRGEGLHRRPRVHRRVRRQGPRLLLLRLLPHAGRRAVRVRLLDRRRASPIDEAADELGTHMCIPPHWEDRRSEISQLEPIDTVETVV